MNRRLQNRFFIMSVVLVTTLILTASYGSLCSGATTTSSSSDVTTMEDGHRLINLARLFVEYGISSQDLDLKQKWLLWEQRLEKNYPDFFNQVIYRNLSGPRRSKFRAEVFNQFWQDVYPHIERIAQLAETSPQLVAKARRDFKKHFPDFQPACDYYLTVSFSFVGKAADLNGATVFVLGLEHFEPDSPGLEITMAHEQFHLHHFKTFSPQGALYRGVWSEGMATVASEVVVPGYRLSQYLGFTPQKMNEIYSRFEELKSLAMANLDQADSGIKRAFLGVESNRLGIPPACGYYIGEHLVYALTSQGYDLSDLARWEPSTVLATMRRLLPALSRD